LKNLSVDFPSLTKKPEHVNSNVKEELFTNELVLTE